MGWPNGPDAGTGVWLLTQDAKVTPATNAAPTAAKREKLIRIEVLSPNVREEFANAPLRRLYRAVFRPEGGCPFPRRATCRTGGLGRGRLKPLFHGLQKMGRDGAVQNPVVEA